MMNDDLDALDSFMERTKARVGTTPVNMNIGVFHRAYPPGFSSHLMQHMHYFTTIASLHYRFYFPQEIHRFLDHLFHAKTANVKKLTISALYEGYQTRE
jgi:hypothetical protein